MRLAAKELHFRLPSAHREYTIAALHEHQKVKGILYWRAEDILNTNEAVFAAQDEQQPSYEHAVLYP